MDIILILGYFSAIIIGISLGLIGGGGSILTVPVLIYFMSVDVVSATAYSLFIVGLTSLIGSVRKYIDGLLNLKTGIVFAIPALMSVWFTRAVIIPAIPKKIGSVFDIPISKDLIILLFFAVIMILSAISMIRSNGKKIESGQIGEAKTRYILITLEGLVVGFITGLVGAGGGFLIVPALVLLARIPMKEAVGTSLMIIAIKSLIGFTGDLINPEINIDWNLLISFSILGIIGILIGGRLSKIVSGEKLKTGFGWFLLITGIFMIFERAFNLPL